MPSCWDAKTFTNRGAPCIFVGCISHALEHVYLSHFLLFWSDELNVINIVDEYIFLWNVEILIMVQIPLDYIMTESEKVNLALEQNLLCGPSQDKQTVYSLLF